MTSGDKRGLLCCFGGTAGFSFLFSFMTVEELEGVLSGALNLFVFMGWG
jgi:hypothetical protein